MTLLLQMILCCVYYYNFIHEQFYSLHILKIFGVNDKRHRRRGAPPPYCVFSPNKCPHVLPPPKKNVFVN